jgi:AcrR family transcriptional regulator
MNIRSINNRAVIAHLGPHFDECGHEILGLMNVRSKSDHAPKRRGRPVVDDKRRRILDAGLQLFADRGFHGVAVPEIAAAASVGTGTVYHYFENKVELVNELYRDIKMQLRSALLDSLHDPDLDKKGAAEAWFTELWHRLAKYAREMPDAFRFLEMQDHVEYLDAESRQVELATIAPLFMVAKRVHDRAGGTRVDVVIALMWGAFVGLVKASRLGYLVLDDASLEEAGKTVWRMFAPEVERALRA